MNKRTSHGFTLIEVLFIIAILSVIASMGIAVFQQRTSTTKLQKAATQLQNLSQAAIDAYSDNGAWPQPFNHSKLKAYIPFADTNNAGEYLNPWGNPYVSTTDKPNAPDFNITTVVPTPAIAEQLKAQLPFATATTDGTKGKIALAIPLPGAIGTANYLVVKQGSIKLNNVNTSSYAPSKFSCPRGYKGGIFVGLKGLLSDWGNAGRIWKYNYSMAIYQAGIQTKCTKQTDNNYQCSFYNLLYTDRQFTFWGSVYRYPMNEKDDVMADKSTDEYSYLQYDYTLYCSKPLIEKKAAFRY